MSIIGTIAVNVVSKHSAFVKGMDQSRTAVGRLSAGIGTADKAMRNLKAAIGFGLAALTTGRIVTALRDTAEQMDALGKTADKLGVASEKLAGLHLGAELEGMDIGGFNTALQQMTRRLSILAATGKGEAAPAIEELGIQIDKIRTLSADKQLEMIADRMQLVTNQADKVRLSVQLFGRSGAGMLAMLKDGAAGLKEYQKEAEKLGIAIDRESISRVEEMNDAMTKLGKAVSGIKERIVIDIAPAATAGIEALLEAVQGLKILREASKKAPQTAAGKLTRDIWGFDPAGKSGMKFLERWMIGRGIASGAAMGTPAPAGDAASMMARQPGFNASRVDQARAQAMAQKALAESQKQQKVLKDQLSAANRTATAVEKLVDKTNTDGEDDFSGL